MDCVLTWIIQQQLWGYNVEEKLHMSVRDQKSADPGVTREGMWKYTQTYYYCGLRAVALNYSIKVLRNEEVIKSYIFLNAILYSPLKVNWRFYGKYRLHLQGEGIRQERREVYSSQFVQSWGLQRYAPPKRRFQNTKTFIATDVRISSPKH
jgi:hypothetical protein